MADQWDSFYRAFAPDGVLSTGQPAFPGVYSDPAPAAVGGAPTSRPVQTMTVDAYGRPVPQQTAAQAVDQVAGPSAYAPAKAYDDRLAPSGLQAYLGASAPEPNPFGLPPVNGGWPYVSAAPAPVAAPAPPPQNVASLFGEAPPNPNAAAPVYAAHAAPGTALSTLASMFVPPAVASPGLQQVQDVVSGRTGNTFASAGNNNASAARLMSPGGSLTGSQL